MSRSNTDFPLCTPDPSPAGLGRVIDSFDFTGWNPHNAGNDAVHTLWAFLAMTVGSATERGSPAVSQRRNEEQIRREKVAAEEAIERVRDGAEGWDVDGEDGGVKVDDGESAEKKTKGYEPWKGSDSGLYLPNGYPLDV